MARINTLTKIEKEVEKLSPREQLKLVEKLAHVLGMKGITTKKQLVWNGLYGLGRGLWEGEDAQKYVDRLRKDRI